MELLGVYDADGGVRGEASYIIGKLLGRRHCTLCDLTHSTVRRRPEWDALVGRVGVPFRLAHLNELTGTESEVVTEVGAPVVLVVGEGRPRALLDRDELAAAGGDLGRFESLLTDALARLP